MTSTDWEKKGKNDRAEELETADREHNKKKCFSVIGGGHGLPGPLATDNRLRQRPYFSYLFLKHIICTVCNREAKT